jgi:hypothetical protein
VRHWERADDEVLWGVRLVARDADLTPRCRVDAHCGVHTTEAAELPAKARPVFERLGAVPRLERLERAEAARAAGSAGAPAHP